MNDPAQKCPTCGNTAKEPRVEDTTYHYRCVRGHDFTKGSTLMPCSFQMQTSLAGTAIILSCTTHREGILFGDTVLFADLVDWIYKHEKEAEGD